MSSPTVYLASYKGTQPGWHGLVNRLIRYGTRSWFSHSEICIGNPFEGEVLCISSSGSDGGVRGKIMKLDPTRWEIVPTQVMASQAIAIMQEEIDCKYDYAGVARFAFAWLPDWMLKPSTNRWFCSEIVGYIMNIPDPWRFDPAEVHAIAQSRLSTHNSGLE